MVCGVGTGVSTIATKAVGVGPGSRACSALLRRARVAPMMPMLARSRIIARPKISIVERDKPPRFSR
jgi:hypothetical protein